MYRCKVQDAGDSKRSNRPGLNIKVIRRVAGGIVVTQNKILAAKRLKKSGEAASMGRRTLNSHGFATKTLFWPKPKNCAACQLYRQLRRLLGI